MLEENGIAKNVMKLGLFSALSAALLNGGNGCIFLCLYLCHLAACLDT